MNGKMLNKEQKDLDGKTIQIGMPLVDKNGNFIGKVKAFEEKGFTVDRSMLHFQELFVPYWISLDNKSGQIQLEIGQLEINQSLWRMSDRQA